MLWWPVGSSPVERPYQRPGWPSPRITVGGLNYVRMVSNPRDPAWDAMTPEAMMAAQRALHPGLDLVAWQRHLAGFDLTPHLAKPMYALSTGSRRKAGLAAALATGAALTLLDEPCAGLDPPSLAYLARALNDAARAAHAAHQPARALLLAGGQALEGLVVAGVIQLADLR